MRYRENTPEELARARAAVAAWRDRNPAGTAEELLAAIGHQFHRDYGVVLRAVLFAVDRHRARQVTGISARAAAATGGYEGMSWRALRLAREEPGQVLRLYAFRAAHPEVIIGDAGFGVWQARIPEPDGERIISRYTLHELLDRLEEFTR